MDNALTMKPKQTTATMNKQPKPHSQLSTLHSPFIKEGYKQTEVGVIPEDWDTPQLKKLVSYTNGVAHEGVISEHGDYIVVNSKFVSTEGKIKKRSKKCFLPATKEDILMVMSDVPKGRAIAKCYRVEKDNLYTVNQRICILRSNGTNGRLLFYNLNRNPYYLAFDDGVKQTNLRKDEVLSCPIPLPPTLAEQKAIAEALSDADSLIESLQQLIAKKRLIKQGAMQILLSPWETENLQIENGELKIENDSSPQHSQLPTLTPPLKKGWVETTLGEFCKIYQPTTISSGVFTSHGFPVFGANGIVGNYPKFNHEQQQVTLTCRGSTSGTINMTPAYCWITGNSMVICPNEGLASKLYLRYALEKSDTESLISGSGLPQITRNNVIVFSVFLPPLTEQTRIATILSDMDEEISTLETKLTKARQIKQGMTSELLTGKIRLV